MVKIFLIFLLSFSISFGDELKSSEILVQKIKTLIDPNVYEQNRDYIGIVFTPVSDYYVGERLNSVKVVQTLKDNGLLNLFFSKPSELNLIFKTSGSPLFFVKLMSDSLRNIGYYRYVTTESNLNASEFTWAISLTSEYATDPLILQKELKKSGCEIVDIQRNSSTQWVYTIDMRDGHLNLETLESDSEIKLKRSLYAYWLNVSNIQNIKIKSSRRNSWYPYITYYDSSLHLLKIIKKNSKTSRLNLKIPKGATYIKISDLYTLKNIKDYLLLTSSGTR